MDEKELQKYINSAYEIPSNVQELRHNVLVLCHEITALNYKNKDLQYDLKYVQDEHTIMCAALRAISWENDASGLIAEDTLKRLNLL